MKALKRTSLVKLPQLLVSVCFFILLSIPLSAQQPDSVYRDTLTLAPSIINRIIITGNFKTKEYIITRELLFHEGDTFPPYVLENAISMSRENLMNIGLFNFVEIHYFKSYQDHVDIHIELTERWYLWPVPVVELADRNFNVWWETKDFSRINYGINLRQDNFRGRDETVRLQMIFGYSQKLGLYYDIPYINRQQNLGLTFGISSTRNEEVNLTTVNNRIVFYNDDVAIVRQEFLTFLTLTRRKGLYQYYTTTLEYRNMMVQDTVIEMNQYFFVEEHPRQQQITVNWSYRMDKRDYKPYALSGYFYQLDVTKIGFGFLPYEPNLIALTGNIRYYHPLSKRFFAGASIKGRITQRSNAPYVNQKALGYLVDYIRGYEYYVMNGQGFVLFHSDIKFALLPKKTYSLPVIGTDKFKKVPIAIYLNAFYDAGAVRDREFYAENPLNNKYQNGYGIGLDYVTYYDVVLRFEYSWNKMGESGLFLHLGAAF